MNPPPFPIVHCADWLTLRPEQQGSKGKAWICRPGPEESRDADAWLFKLPRPGHGDHWAEKVSAEVARLLSIPCAEVEIARYEDQLGCISKNLSPKLPERTVALLHGNKVLQATQQGYDAETKRPKDHTVDLILGLLHQTLIAAPRNYEMPAGIQSAADVMVGYFLLDALIGNTDRHHENWGLLLDAHSSEHGARISLCPSYDHGSTLGRDLTDEARSSRLSGSDPRVTVDSYCARGRTPLYTHPATRRLKYRAVFQVAQTERPTAARRWLDKLEEIPESTLLQLVDRVPDELASDITKRFTKELLQCNRSHLLQLR